ncbi:MAG: hypothetical protein ACFB15_08010 [Cyclobacteriaceae bacterium]
MYIPFDEMPATARVWVYQTNRPLNNIEQNYALQRGQQFASQWAAHGQDLRSSVQVLHNHFLIMAVDEQYNAASGCSIDSSVGLVRELEQQFGQQSRFSFFDRLQIAFWQDDEVHLLPMKEAKTKVSNGEISPEALMFDNTVPTKEALENRWKIPVKDSWLARFVPKEVSN